jgi:hypothetical protein
MARAAVLDAILADQCLIDLGFDASNVLVNYNASQRPTDTTFMVLHWDQETPGIRGDDTMLYRSFKLLTVWVHVYKEFSTDFVRIDAVLDALDVLMTSLIHVEGADGYTLSLAEVGQRSRDLRDDAYQTICRSASYRILDRVTASV